MRGNAQPDRRPWVGQNSGPIFRRLWTKVRRIKCTYAGVSVLFATPFSD